MNVILTIFIFLIPFFGLIATGENKKWIAVVLGAILFGGSIALSELLCPYLNHDEYHCTYEALEMWPMLFISGLFFWLTVWFILFLIKNIRVIIREIWEMIEDSRNNH